MLIFQQWHCEYVFQHMKTNIFCFGNKIKIKMSYTTFTKVLATSSHILTFCLLVILLHWNCPDSVQPLKPKLLRYPPTHNLWQTSLCSVWHLIENKKIFFFSMKLQILEKLKNKMCLSVSVPSLLSSSQITEAVLAWQKSYHRSLSAYACFCRVNLACTTVTNDKSRRFLFPRHILRQTVGRGGGGNQWLTNGNVLTVSALKGTAFCEAFWDFSTILFKQFSFIWFIYLSKQITEKMSSISNILNFT